MLITNANKYGLIKGGYAAEQLELTPEGIKALDDELPRREQAKARIQLAVDQIEPFAKLYERFAGNKLPARAALVDAVKDFDVPSELAEEATDTLVVNLRFLELLQTLSGAERIVTKEHLLDSLPASPIRNTSIAAATPQVAISTSKAGTGLVTIEHAQFDATCFYVTPIGEDGSEQRKHSDLFLGSIVEPALEQLGLKVIRADAIDKPGTILS